MPFCIGWVENFDEITLSCTVENFNEITLFCTVKATLCFSILGKNLKIQIGRHMWGGENFLKIAKSTFLRYPVVALSRTVKEIEANLCFAILGKKFENSKWPPYVGRGKLLKIAKSTLLRYPVGRKFRRNPSISHG